MTVCTVNHQPAATHGETARCLFAIELSRKSWVIGIITPLSAKISRRILSGGARPVSRLRRARTSSINSSRPLQSFFLATVAISGAANSSRAARF